MRLGLLACWLVVSSVGCTGKTSHTPPTASAGAAGTHEPGSGGEPATEGGAASSRGGAGSDGACSSCPSAPHVQLCCDEYCGYLNAQTNGCEPSRAGSNVLTIVTAPAGGLCPTSNVCKSDAACPESLPEDGSSCSSELQCTYCAAPAIPRTIACVDGHWATVGPNPPCGYTVEP